MLGTRTVAGHARALPLAGLRRMGGAPGVSGPPPRGEGRPDSRRLLQAFFQMPMNGRFRYFSP